MSSSELINQPLFNTMEKKMSIKPSAKSITLSTMTITNESLAHMNSTTVITTHQFNYHQLNVFWHQLVKAGTYKTTRFTLTTTSAISYHQLITTHQQIMVTLMITNVAIINYHYYPGSSQATTSIIN